MGTLYNTKGKVLALVTLSLSMGISEKNDRPCPLAGKVAAQLTERVTRLGSRSTFDKHNTQKDSPKAKWPCEHKALEESY